MRSSDDHRRHKSGTGHPSIPLGTLAHAERVVPALHQETTLDRSMDLPHGGACSDAATGEIDQGVYACLHQLCNNAMS